MARKRTSTSSFGVAKREGHDASEFYARFVPPTLSTDSTVNQCAAADQLILGDSRDMAAVAENSVALITTSPPYHASKEYEQEMGVGHVPASYFEYLEMLHDVFAECLRVLEPGGRIAVNVANLGRKPFRSLSKDVWVILEGLGFLPRGEIVWIKAAGASGNCAWGSWMSPSNPALRDVTERILVAGKGRFERAVHWKERKALGLPWEATIGRDEFLAWTLDTWDIRPESARRVGHPAPFPVELPRRLIELYTYRDDVVLDPFIGAGSTAVAAVESGRRYVGFDTDATYLELARHRISQARGDRAAG
ncbi:MAG: site-specific DNA-methyltransferase [Acidimicrobiales bacterium]|nr:site-specific DNA-methyltransferase [Acidimicrobiales bacterium]